jgi:phage portal protein BeeE
MGEFIRQLSTFNIGKAFKSLSSESGNTPAPIYIDPATHTTPNGEDGWFFESTGSENRYFRYTDYSSCVDAYVRCPPVQAIINRKAQALINGKTWVLDKKGKESTSPAADAIRKLLNNPNPIQTGKQFEAQGYIYQQIFGFNIVLPVKPFGFNEWRSLWNIPASWIDWNATNELFTANGGVAIEQLVISFNNRRVTFNIADLIIIRDFTPSFNTITFPASKIAAMALPINNIIGAYESRGILINHRGALGILTTAPQSGQYSSVPLRKEQKQELQSDFRRYGLRKGQWQVILTSASLKWQQMGYATKDLLLMEEVVESSKSLCDGLNFPPHLLGLIDPSFNNQNTAEKSLYQNSIIPDAENINEYWNRFFKTEELGLRIDKDFSHITVLQEDKEEAARARYIRNQALLIEYQNNLITANRWRELNGEDTVPGDDKYMSDRTKLELPVGDTSKELLINAIINANGNGKH